jgi:hypothetical protein
VKSGSPKPSTSIWTGPISDPIGEMYDAFVRLLDQRLVMRRVEVIPGDRDQAFARFEDALDISAR